MERILPLSSFVVAVAEERMLSREPVVNRSKLVAVTDRQTLRKICMQERHIKPRVRLPNSMTFSCTTTEDECDSTAPYPGAYCIFEALV